MRSNPGVSCLGHPSASLDSPGFHNCHFGIGYSRIKQAEATLGPPRDYSTKTRGYTSIGFEPVKGRSATDRTVLWKDDYVCWEVDINKNEVITYSYRLNVVEDPRSWLHRQIDYLLNPSAPSVTAL